VLTISVHRSSCILHGQQSKEKDLILTTGPKLKETRYASKKGRGAPVNHLS
jgi:hypothetical protein